jgi:hypothetical protein
MQGSHKQTLTLSPQGEALNSRQFASRRRTLLEYGVLRLLANCLLFKSLSGVLAN